LEKDKEYLILSMLRQNSRASLTEMSKYTRIPVSTIYDRLKVYRSGLIKKYTSLIDFTQMGFTTRAAILLKSPGDQRDNLKEFLLKHQSVNNLLKVNNGYDFFVEAIFKTIQEMELFMESLEIKFGVDKKQAFYIVDEFKREGFMSNPEYVKLCWHEPLVETI